MGVTRIFSNFRLDLEEKAGAARSPRSELSTKISANNFASPDAEENTSGPLHRATVAAFSNLSRMAPVEFLRGDRLPRFISKVSLGVHVLVQEPFCINC